MKSKAQQVEQEATIISAQKALAEQRRMFRDADDIRNQSNTLLKPDDILNGKVDAGKLYRYMTRNPDGTYRPIRIQDVLDFDKRRAQLRSRWQKGIRARDIIDLSKAVVPHQKQSALVKAREQIKTAVPIASKAGELRFATNTGPKSDRDRQYVTIKMLNFEAAVASPVEPSKIVKEVTEGPLAIGCSCGDFRFTYAYLCTSAGFGLPEHRETAFPKIKIFQLVGVGCKHIVKVASVMIQSPTVRTYVARLIEQERNKTQSRLTRNAIADQREIQAKMARENYRQRRVATTEEKKAERDRWKKPATESETQLKARAAAKAKARAVKQSTKTVENNVKKLLSLGAITQAQADAMLGALKG